MAKTREARKSWWVVHADHVSSVTRQKHLGQSHLLTTPPPHPPLDPGAKWEQTLVYLLYLRLTEAFQRTTLCGGQCGRKPRNTTFHGRAPGTGPDGFKTRDTEDTNTSQASLVRAALFSLGDHFALHSSPQSLVRGPRPLVSVLGQLMLGHKLELLEAIC